MERGKAIGFSARGGSARGGRLLMRLVEGKMEIDDKKSNRELMPIKIRCEAVLTR